MNPAHRVYGIQCTYVHLLLHKRYRRIVALNLFWKNNATECIYCCSFLQKQYKLKEDIFCLSPGVHMYRARGDLSTVAALLTAGVLIPKCII